MKFNIYTTLAPKALIGTVEASSPSDACASARIEFGDMRVYIARPVKTRAEAAEYVAKNGFKRAQARIGLEVYKAPSPDKRAKEELTIGADLMNLYQLSPRKWLQSWDIVE